MILYGQESRKFLNTDCSDETGDESLDEYWCEIISEVLGSWGSYGEVHGG